MVSVNNSYGQNMYPVAKSTMNHYVQTGDVARAIQYARGESAQSLSHNPTMKETLMSIPLCVGIMGGLNAVIFNVGNALSGNLVSGFKKKWADIKLTRSSTDFLAHHYDRVAKHTEGILSGLNSKLPSDKIKYAAESLDDLSKAQKMMERSQRLIDKAKVNTNAVMANKQKARAEKIAVKAKHLMPAAEVGDKIGSKIWHYVKMPFKAMSNNSVMRAFEETKVGKHFFRGGGVFFAAMEMGIEGFTEVLPAFREGGIVSGVKQLFKSTVKAAASIAGFMGGEALGAPAGAILGGIIGAPFGGPVGASIGAWLGGFIGGIAGGFILSTPAVQLAKAITGKTEKEKLHEAKLQQEAAQMMQSPENLKQLAETNLTRAQQEQQNGNNSKETQQALKFGRLATQFK